MQAAQPTACDEKSDRWGSSPGEEGRATQSRPCTKYLLLCWLQSWSQWLRRCYALCKIPFSFLTAFCTAKRARERAAHLLQLHAGNKFYLISVPSVRTNRAYSTSSPLENCVSLLCLTLKVSILHAASYNVSLGRNDDNNGSACCCHRQCELSMALSPVKCVPDRASLQDLVVRSDSIHIPNIFPPFGPFSRAQNCCHFERLVWIPVVS